LVKVNEEKVLFLRKSIYSQCKLIPNPQATAGSEAESHITNPFDFPSPPKVPRNLNVSIWALSSTYLWVTNQPGVGRVSERFNRLVKPFALLIDVALQELLLPLSLN
jgi:hypothetical protein